MSNKKPWINLYNRHPANSSLFKYSKNVDLSKDCQQSNKKIPCWSNNNNRFRNSFRNHLNLKNLVVSKHQLSSPSIWVRDVPHRTWKNSNRRNRVPMMATSNNFIRTGNKKIKLAVLLIEHRGTRTEVVELNSNKKWYLSPNHPRLRDNHHCHIYHVSNFSWKIKPHFVSCQNSN